MKVHMYKKLANFQS